MVFYLFRIVGYISKRLGRTAASAVGGGFFLLQAAHQSGYLTINWKKVNRDVRSAQDLVEKKIKQKSDSILPFTRRVSNVLQSSMFFDNSDANLLIFYFLGNILFYG